MALPPILIQLLSKLAIISKIEFFQKRLKLIEKEYIELLMLRNLDKNITQKALAKEFGFSIIYLF